MKRTALGLTQAQLSASAGVSERLVRSLEQGEATGIGLDKLISVLTVLGIELSLSNGARTPQSDRRADEYEKLLERSVASWTRGAGYGD